MEEIIYYYVFHKYCKNKCCSGWNGFQQPFFTKVNVLCGNDTWSSVATKEKIEEFDDLLANLDQK